MASWPFSSFSSAFEEDWLFLSSTHWLSFLAHTCSLMTAGLTSFGTHRNHVFISCVSLFCHNLTEVVFVVFGWFSLCFFFLTFVCKQCSYKNSYHYSSAPAEACCCFDDLPCKYIIWATASSNGSHWGACCISSVLKECVFPSLEIWKGCFERKGKG